MRSMSSSVNFETQQARQLLTGIKKKLINPIVEARSIEKFAQSRIQDHFNKTMSPVGLWRKSYAAIRENRLTLTKTRALRDGLKAVFDVARGQGIKINFVPSAKTRKYAYTHNNGLRVRLWGKYPYQFPKRQFAWLDANDKRIIEDIFIGALF